MGDAMSQQPSTPPGPRGEAQSAQQQLANVPEYRRSATASALLLISLGAYFVGAIMGGAVLRLLAGAPLLAVCVIVLTGDVYFSTVDAQGRLKKWGVGNKVAAALLMGGWILLAVRAL